MRRPPKKSSNDIASAKIGNVKLGMPRPSPPPSVAVVVVFDGHGFVRFPESPPADVLVDVGRADVLDDCGGKTVGRPPPLELDVGVADELVVVVVSVAAGLPQVGKPAEPETVAPPPPDALVVCAAAEPATRVTNASVTNVAVAKFRADIQTPQSETAF